MDNHHQRILNDLEWLLNSQPLLLSSTDQFDFSLPEKEKIIKSITKNNIYPGEIPVRLGRHFENLFEMALRTAFPEAEIIRGFKIFNKKRTVGEIDFILKRKNTPPLQIEIAVKFYLQLNPTGTLGDFVGPNKHDSLEAKYKKLRSQPWKEFSNLEIEESKYFLKGNLFYPFESQVITNNACPMLHPLHPRSFWVEAHCLEKIVNKFPDARLILPLRKNEWISNCCFLEKDRDPIPLDTFTKTDITKPQYVALLTEANTPQEITRGFIVPSRWENP